MSDELNLNEVIEEIEQCIEKFDRPKSDLLKPILTRLYAIQQQIAEKDKLITTLKAENERLKKQNEELQSGLSAWMDKANKEKE